MCRGFFYTWKCQHKTIVFQIRCDKNPFPPTDILVEKDGYVQFKHHELELCFELPNFANPILPCSEISKSAIYHRPDAVCMYCSAKSMVVQMQRITLPGQQKAVFSLRHPPIVVQEEESSNPIVEPVTPVEREEAQQREETQELLQEADINLARFQLSTDSRPANLVFGCFIPHPDSVPYMYIQGQAGSSPFYCPIPPELRRNIPNDFPVIYQLAQLESAFSTNEFEKAALENLEEREDENEI